MTTVQTLTDLRSKQIAQTEAQLPVVRMGFGSQQGFELMQRGAKLLAASTLVPKEYQGNISNCVIALNMADRLGADPLMVMQNLYVVHGRPGWSAQFLIASFNQCGRFSAIRYKWGGTEGKDDWSCQAYATERDTNEVITGPLISIALSKKEGWYAKGGSKWQSIPQLMLMYRAAAWLVRTHAPEISMGLQTADELHDVFDARADSDGTFLVTTESLRDAAVIPQKTIDAAEIIDTATGEVVTAPHGDGGRSGVQMKDVQASLESATTLEQLNEAADMVREVANPVHRDLLNGIYEKKAAELQ